jgi:hypothetical protein
MKANSFQSGNDRAAPVAAALPATPKQSEGGRAAGDRPDFVERLRFAQRSSYRWFSRAIFLRSRNYLLAR